VKNLANISESQASSSLVEKKIIQNKNFPFVR